MRTITTSISTFKNIISANYLYVDKTADLYELVRNPFGQYFFSRPRRFGKSLTVSTLDVLFRGHKELFEGLRIFETDYNWETYPVIHIDFGKSDCTSKINLEGWLNAELHSIASEYEVSISGGSPALLFGRLIKELYAKFQKGVVILVDEYDRPVTSNLEDGRKIKEVRLLLEAFYQIIKGYEEFERFVFLTGITKLSQISIFSNLNNLEDISRNPKYANLVGYTQSELEAAFAEHIKEASEYCGITEDELKTKLARWYDGFRFTYEDSKVYNPVSIGRFFNEKYQFRNYWFATATPMFLINQAKKQCLSVGDIDHAVFTEFAYNAFNVEELMGESLSVHSLIQLLFQTGYLTFGEKLDNSIMDTYRLVYPNYEVQMSFEMELMAIYAGQGVQEINSIIAEVQKAAGEGNADQMILILKSLFAGIPYNIQLKYEKYYQSLLYLIFKMCGMDIIAEDVTNIGRIDATLQTGQFVYVIECKIDKTAEEALEQANRKMYAEKYLYGRQKKVIALGINFSSNEKIRNIDGYLINECFNE